MNWKCSFCYLVNFCVCLIFLCSPMQTSFIENEQLSDRWLYFYEIRKNIFLFSPIISNVHMPHPLILTDALQCSFEPQPWVATNWCVASPPAVIAWHTPVDHNTSVVPNHLWVDELGNGATFSWRDNEADCLTRRIDWNRAQYDGNGGQRQFQ